MNTILVMPDGVEVHTKKDGYHCPALPALGKVLNFMYPVGANPLVNAERVGRRYGWRIQQATEAIAARNNQMTGVGV